MTKNAADAAETESTAANVNAQLADASAQAADVSAQAADVSAQAAEVQALAATVAAQASVDAINAYDAASTPIITETWKAHFNRRIWDKPTKILTLFDNDKRTPLKVFDTNADMSEITPQ